LSTIIKLLKVYICRRLITCWSEDGVAPWRATLAYATQVAEPHLAIVVMGVSKAWVMQSHGLTVVEGAIQALPAASRIVY